MAKNNTNPFLERITPTFGNSFKIKQYSQPNPNPYLPLWHFHPELELVFIKSGNGKRHIGHNLSYFRDGDLILLGENLPHFGFTDRLTGNLSETVIQFQSNFLGDSFFESFEMADVKQLIERSKAGLVFFGKTKMEVGQRIEEMINLSPFSRLIELLFVLQLLAKSNDYKMLHAEGLTIEVASQDNQRVNEVYNFVRKNFQRPITLEEISSEINMTVSAFCRYFKKLSGKTFTQFVNEFRVVHACKLLTEKPISIADASMESGFNNFSHFSKQFKEVTKKSPSAYRKEVRQIVK